MSPGNHQGPLRGVRVVDLTRLIPGPLCTMHLADMGADVIKVEQPEGGDPARQMGSLWRLLNRNKRSIVIDLKTNQGRDIFLSLARGADVVIESFRPGVMDRLGIGYDACRALRPDQIFCGISAYGQTGPYRDRAGHDVNFLAQSGVLHEMGTEDGPPSLCNLQIADVIGGALSSAMTILAALFDASRSGRGRYLDVSMTDSVLSSNIMPLVSINERGRTQGRGADLLSGALPWYNVYETSDGRHLALGALEEKFWRRFCRVIEREEWCDQQCDEAARSRIKDELALILKEDTLDGWLARFEGVDCCLSPVLSLEEAIESDLVKGRNMIRNLSGCLQWAFPVASDDMTSSSRDKPAPELGEHTDEILAEIGHTP